jgi:hypothetical protein
MYFKLTKAIGAGTQSEMVNQSFNNFPMHLGHNKVANYLKNSLFAGEFVQ